MKGTVRTDRFTMDYIKFGNGSKTMVILPGMSLIPLSAIAPQVEAGYAAFGERFTVYVFDRTNNMPEAYTTEQMAEDTVEAIDILGLTDIALFGVSHGGMMAILVATSRQDLVQKLVLGSTMPGHNSVEEATFSEWYRLAQAGDIPTLCRSVNTHVYSAAYLAKYQKEFAAEESQIERNYVKRFAVLAQAGLRFDAEKELHRITCPTLVIGAGRDAVLSGKASQKLAECIGADLILYPDAPHAAYDELPEYRQQVFDFLVKRFG